MKLLLAITACSAIAVAGLLALDSPKQSEPTTTTKEVMKFKLLYAQRVLEGIATENYEVIDENARHLRKLAGQAGWQVKQSPEYQRITAEFARNAEALSKAAEKKNVDAATVAYFQMTVNCTTCHKYLRGEQGVGFNQSLEGVVPALAKTSPETGAQEVR